MLFTIDGSRLKEDKEGRLNGIPERCPECRCPQDKSYVDFTSKTVHKCGQCGELMYLQ